MQTIVWDLSQAYDYWVSVGDQLNKPFNLVQLRILLSEVMNEIICDRAVFMPSDNTQKVLAVRGINRQTYNFHMNNILDSYQSLIGLFAQVRNTLRYDYVVNADYIFNTDTSATIRLHCTKPSRNYYDIIKSEVEAAVEKGEQVPLRYLEIVQNGNPI